MISYSKIFVLEAKLKFVKRLDVPNLAVLVW